MSTFDEVQLYAPAGDLEHGEVPHLEIQVHYITGLARLDWHFVKHLGTTVGFGAEHFSVSKTLLNDTVFARTLTVSPTTYGPLLGIGIYF